MGMTSKLYTQNGNHIDSVYARERYRNDIKTCTKAFRYK